MVSKGQALALEQLERICVTGSSIIKILAIKIPEHAGGKLVVHIKLFCGNFPTNESGLSLRRWEKFCIDIPVGFPFDIPSIDVPHIRFSSFPHVQWKRHLCLYQAPDSEWNASDGLYGYLQRLDDWLRAGAMNQLDPNGQALHPPAVYASSKSKVTIIPRANIPDVNRRTWFGFGHLDIKSERRIDIVGWSEYSESESPNNVAAVILLPDMLPFEYPKKAGELFNELLKMSVDNTVLHAIFHLSLAKNEDGTALYFIVGTPMRGVAGEQQNRKFHLAAWEINSDLADILRLETKASILGNRVQDEEGRLAVQKIAMDCKNLFETAIAASDIIWCSIYEDRPEIVTRRDYSTNINWFKGKTIAIWGCGALGSYVAEILARAGVRKLILRDNKVVKPGLLVRQNYSDSQVGYTKNSCLRNNVKSIRPDIEIEEVSYSDISDDFTLLSELNDGADLILDLTASNRLSAKFEYYVKSKPMGIPFVSMSINHMADKGLIAFILPSNGAVSFDADRRAKLTCCESSGLRDFLFDFWPTKDALKMFQPEPGCSDPTFIGSCCDIMQLASTMTNRLAVSLNSAVGRWGAKVEFVSGHSPSPALHTFKYLPDIRIPNIGGYFDVRLRDGAWKKMQRIIGESKTHKGQVSETGGLLFGQIDDAVGIVWITDVIGPSPDSVASPKEFICGVEGTSKINSDLKERSQGSVQYIGMWHTHPVSEARPSDTDLRGMATVLSVDDFSTPRQLLLIVGYSSSQPELGAYLFRSQDIGLANGDPVVKLDILEGNIVAT